MEIRPYPKNAKEHPPAQVELIARSISRFGWQQPIKVGEDMVIIAGHGRWLAYTEYKEKLPMKEPWIIDKEGNTISGEAEKRKLDAKEEMAYRLADNQINALSGNDMTLVKDDLKMLDDPELVELTGYDSDLLIDPEDKDDEVPEVPKEAKSQIGDLYELGQHRLLCGDSTQIEAVSALTGGAKADMLVTDPPYNVDYKGKTKDALEIENDKMSDTTFRQFLTDAFTNAFTAMKGGAVFYIFHADSEGYNFRGAIHDIGEKVRQCLIWNKNTMVMGRQDYHWKHEPILYGWKEGASHLWNSDRTQVTVLDFIRPTANKEHPTMKPVELISYLIGNNSKGEDIILDLFAGGGSTLIACQKSGRICHAMELDPKYVDVIVQRYVDYTGNETIIKNGETIQWQKSQKTAQKQQNG